MDRLITQLGRSKVILAFIIGIGLIAGYLGYTSQDVPIVIDVPVERDTDIESFRNFTLDFKILNDERYKSLEIFGENPVDPGITGERKNPFAPF